MMIRTTEVTTPCLHQKFCFFVGGTPFSAPRRQHQKKYFRESKPKQRKILYQKLCRTHHCFLFFVYQRRKQIICIRFCSRPSTLQIRNLQVVPHLARANLWFAKVKVKATPSGTPLATHSETSSPSRTQTICMCVVVPLATQGEWMCVLQTICPQPNDSFLKTLWK